MFRALILEEDEQMISSLEEALFSMNFECVKVPSVEKAKAKLVECGETFGILFICADLDRIETSLVSEIQEELGLSRPVIGLTIDDNYATDHKFNAILKRSTEQMLLRSIIDDVLYEQWQAPAVKKLPRVLVIEDDPLQSSILSRRLVKEGYEPFVALNGIVGQEEAERLLPQLIVMDVNLPGLDGLSLGRALKSSEKTQDIPIIGVSAANAEKACLEAGFDCFLEKPYSSKKLLNTIESLLNPDMTPNLAAS